MAVIQKKICTVGVFATGKTSLVQRFVHSRFTDKYHSTVGVKVDRKEVTVSRTQVNLLLWDLAGQDHLQAVRESYLRGSSGIVLVADGTRAETVADLDGLRTLVLNALGPIPVVVAVNKADLDTQWQVGPDALRALGGERRLVLTTSAKTGAGVDEAFRWLAEQMLVG